MIVFNIIFFWFKCNNKTLSSDQQKEIENKKSKLDKKYSESESRVLVPNEESVKKSITSK